jgi:hypothetical protein
MRPQEMGHGWGGAFVRLLRAVLRLPGSLLSCMLRIDVRMKAIVTGRLGRGQRKSSPSDRRRTERLKRRWPRRLRPADQRTQRCAEEPRQKYRRTRRPTGWLTKLRSWL